MQEQQKQTLLPDTAEGGNTTQALGAGGGHVWATAQQSGDVHSPAQRSKGARLPPEPSKEWRYHVSTGASGSSSAVEQICGQRTWVDLALVRAGGAAKDLKANMAVTPKVIPCPWGQRKTSWMIPLITGKFNVPATALSLDKIPTLCCSTFEN